MKHKVDIFVKVKQYPNKTDMPKVKKATRVIEYRPNIFKTDYTHNYIWQNETQAASKPTYAPSKGNLSKKDISQV